MQDLAEKSNQYFHTLSALTSSTYATEQAVGTLRRRSASLQPGAELAVSAVGLVPPVSGGHQPQCCSLDVSWSTLSTIP